VDPEACAASKEDSELEAYLIELALIQASRPDLFETGLSKIGKLNGDEKIIQTIASSLGDAVRAIQIPEAWATAELQELDSTLPTNIATTSFTSFDREPSAPKPLLHSWHAAAKRLAFKEAYGTQTALRPDLSVKTWTVHVKEKRRLTPETYERNVFHIEFDLGTSGLRYEIGEALGIHAENDEAEVRQFIKDYGLDADALIEVPSREDAGVLELRTVYQALLRNVDIFGRPPKKFYEALAEYADDPKEKEDLLSLASPAGATEFKRRAEVDTVTFADLLLEYASARPSIYDLLRIVSPMKRREYSIASSQKVTPQGVSLLIVTVDWTDSKGRRRFGQATRYLNALRAGAAVTVSVKPSVMKLPTRAAQPIILAGLGTGLAPFRAFVQHRAWQRAQGEDIGAVLLYMGSRHQREEYLYGEEWEAYREAGVITLLGCAFSRDQPQKVYIQDRMRQTQADIVHAYLRQAGSFYLCGPTWPVPDVTQVLQEAIAAHAQAEGRKVDARREIERLKDESRYVLEGKMLLDFIFLDSLTTPSPLPTECLGC
jgi:sulfite reductase (NADPH) flavoprotein alpha-component